MLITALCWGLPTSPNMSESRIGNTESGSLCRWSKVGENRDFAVVFLNVKLQAVFFPGCPSFSKWSSIFKSVLPANSYQESLRQHLDSKDSCWLIGNCCHQVTVDTNWEVFMRRLHFKKGIPGKSLKLHGLLLHNVDLGKFRFSLHFKCRGQSDTLSSRASSMFNDYPGVNE